MTEAQLSQCAFARPWRNDGRSALWTSTDALALVLETKWDTAGRLSRSYYRYSIRLLFEPRINIQHCNIKVLEVQ